MQYSSGNSLAKEQSGRNSDEMEGIKTVPGNIYINTEQLRQ
jgi:hypothetical protein